MATPDTPARAEPGRAPDYRLAIKLALSAFAAPATEENSMARAATFVCYLSGILKGAGDEDLGGAVFAIVRPPNYDVPVAAQVAA